MQFDLNGSLGSAAVPGGLKNTAEYICHARTGLLPSKAGVKSHHGMGNQVDGLGLVGKAFIEQFTFLEVKSKREKADKTLNSSSLQNYVSSRQRKKIISTPEFSEGEDLSLILLTDSSKQRRCHCALSLTFHFQEDDLVTGTL